MHQTEIEKSSLITSKNNRQQLDSLDDRLLKQAKQFKDLEEKMVRSLDSQLALGTNMLQMREQLVHQQLDKLMNAVTNIAVQTAVKQHDLKTTSNIRNRIGGY